MDVLREDVMLVILRTCHHMFEVFTTTKYLIKTKTPENPAKITPAFSNVVYRNNII